LTYPNCTCTVSWRKSIRHMVLGLGYSLRSHSPAAIAARGISIRISKLTFHSDLRRRAASRLALPCTSSLHVKLTVRERDEKKANTEQRCHSSPSHVGRTSLLTAVKSTSVIRWHWRHALASTSGRLSAHAPTHRSSRLDDSAARKSPLSEASYEPLLYAVAVQRGCLYAGGHYTVGHKKRATFIFRIGLTFEKLHRFQ